MPGTIIALCWTVMLWFNTNSSGVSMHHDCHKLVGHQQIGDETLNSLENLERCSGAVDASK
jgi:hypothetical protein